VYIFAEQDECFYIRLLEPFQISCFVFSSRNSHVIARFISVLYRRNLRRSPQVAYRIARCSPDATTIRDSPRASEDTHSTMTHSQSQHTAIRCHPNGPIAGSTFAAHTEAKVEEGTIETGETGESSSGN